MKFTLGFLAGLGAAWAALAIWQRTPEIGPIDAVDERGVTQLFEPFWGIDSRGPREIADEVISNVTRTLR